MFQSTPPARAATPIQPYHAVADLVSIHAAREGGDQGRRNNRLELIEFQSTPPARAATSGCPASHCRCLSFNPRRPRCPPRLDPGPCLPFPLFQSPPPPGAATAGLRSSEYS